MLNRAVLVVAFLGVLGGSPPASAGIVTFTDGAFADGDWTVVQSSFRDTGGALPGGSVVATQEPGGNPGTMRAVTNAVVAAPSGSEYASTFGIHIRSGTTYDPGTQGPIATIDYFEDARNITAGQLSGLAVRQNGRVYYTQAGVHAATTWGRVSQLGIVPGVFSEMTADGWIPASKPDFSASGAPLEFGFVRASSNGNGGPAYSVIAAIDNWLVRINPSCTVDAECDDGDACTTEACSAGVCAAVDQDCDDGDLCTIDTCADGVCGHAARDCDDGDACTVDGCTDGTCTNTVVDCDDRETCTLDACELGTCIHVAFGDFATIAAKVDALLARLGGAACDAEPLVRKLRRKLTKKLKKAGKAFRRAENVTNDDRTLALLDKGDALLVKAEAILASATDAGLIGAECATDLHLLLESIRTCVTGLTTP